MSDLREKVAFAIEPNAWKEGKRFNSMGNILAREKSLRQADAAIAVCMEEAAEAAAECPIFGNAHEIESCGSMIDAWELGSDQTLEQVAAALRALRGEGGVDRE